MFETIIGIEVHCELKTQSKMFSSAPVSFGQPPNSQAHVIDLAMPGTLPSVNKKAVEMAIRVCHALHMDIDSLLRFDRKNYYYPDLPKGFQITQQYHPIGKNGYLDIEVNGQKIHINIEQLHLEEDTAKLTHDDDCTLIDYNRAGIPLIEIVTQPQFHNSQEVCAYLEALRMILIYTDVSDAIMAQGSMRCDINISLRHEGSQGYGEKVEIKNLNSLANVQKAIDFEIQRQTELLLNHYPVPRQTRRFDEKTQKTIAMRDKELLADYRYYPEPNILPVRLPWQWIESIKDHLPVLPAQRRDKYIHEYKLSVKEADTLLLNKDLSDFYDQVVKQCIYYDTVCHWLIGDVLSYLHKNHLHIHDIFEVQDFAKLMNMTGQGIVSSKQTKQVLSLMILEKKDPLTIMQKHHIQQMNDENVLIELIEELLDNHFQLVQDYHQGKTNLLGYFVGQVMKKTQGQANPQKTNQLLKQLLEKRKT